MKMLFKKINKALVSKSIAIVLLGVMAAACGGGGGTSAPVAAASAAVDGPMPSDLVMRYQTRLMVHPTDKVVNEPGFNLSAQTHYNESDPVKSVAAQASLPGDVLMLPGFTRKNGFVNLDVYLQEALKYPNIKYVYLYDELFWNGNGISIGKDEVETLEAARKTHAAGLKTAITFQPSVVLDPAFAIKDINAFDVIGLDPYPSAFISNYTGDCKYNDNLQTTLLYCSIQKLKALGYKGDLWYVYQAFGVNTVKPETLKADLAAQRDTIAIAPSFGVVGVAPFGLYLGTEEITTESFLYQGQGSAIESLVR